MNAVSQEIMYLFAKITYNYLLNKLKIKLINFHLNGSGRRNFVENWTLELKVHKMII